MSDSAKELRGLKLGEEVSAALEAVLPSMAERTVAAVTVEVPSYTAAFGGRMGQTIENAVQMALGAFLRLATRADDADAGPQLAPALDGAYSLGEGEARQGRSIDALLAAYRVGARVAWREFSAIAVDAGVSAATIARFAELVFEFIDELSASSAAGHANQLAAAGRARGRHLERLGHHIISGEPLEVLQDSADRADWAPPTSLTAVLMPAVQTRAALMNMNPSTLQISDELPGLDPADSLSLLLVPDVDEAGRRQLLNALEGRRAWVGPEYPWTHASASYRRAVRVRALIASGPSDVIDADHHLVELVLGADPEAAEDLRRRALAPLAGLRPNSAERLVETLRSWLLHHGHREAVAADLFVHVQTVRYRMTQLRELYGDALDDPRTILELTVALGLARHPAHRDERDDASS